MMNYFLIVIQDELEEVKEIVKSSMENVIKLKVPLIAQN